jgi:V/A-type H+-transporting ATPase subunit K
LFIFYYHDLNKELCRKLNMKPVVLLLSFAAVALMAAGLTDVAFAEEEVATGGMSDGSKLIGAGIAFGVAAGGAGVGLGQVGAAGLAVISENPALQSKVFIFVGMVESIAIYGIVMMFIILGQ